MINPVWNKLAYKRPDKSGLYLLRESWGIDIFYYCKPIDYFVMIDCEYQYLDGYPAKYFGDEFWAKMPRIPQSKLLNGNTIKITT